MAANYSPPITDNLKLAVNVNYYWRSKANFSPLGDPLTKVDAYGVLGASLGVEDRGGRWSLSIFAKNLLNENFPAGVGRIGPLYGAAEQAGLYTYRSPDTYRQIGATLDVSF